MYLLGVCEAILDAVHDRFSVRVIPSSTLGDFLLHLPVLFNFQEADRTGRKKGSENLTNRRLGCTTQQIAAFEN